jgi:glutamate-ammonia-ligase adenylyltransferase
MFASLGDDDDDHRDIDALLRDDLDAEAEAQILRQLGFVDLTAAAADLHRIRERRAKINSELLAEIAASTDPDQALRYLADLIAKRGEQWSIWKLLAENPVLMRLLGSLLGASAYLARTLVDTPELIDLLVQLGLQSPTRDTAQVAADLHGRLASVDPDDPEAIWSAVAEIKNGHVLRVGLADFAGALDALAVCNELTSIAEACLQQALVIVQRQLPPIEGRLAVLAMGKLGGRELGYAADLDVVFVYESDDESAVVHFSRIAQRLLGALRLRTPRGRLYEVDTRLRPSGSQGLLVTSLAAWRRYHAESAQLWERQALTKLRPVAGDAALGEEVARLTDEFVYGTPPASLPAIADAIVKMRQRIERELGGPSDLKAGAGGVIDVEFAAQYLQLAHGHAHPALRTTSTVHALRAAAHAGVAAARDVELLDQGYRFLRGIENRLRVVNDQPVHRLPDTKVELDKLARRSGFPDGALLREHVERWQREIRLTFLALLGA